MAESNGQRLPKWPPTPYYLICITFYLDEEPKNYEP